ncbi:MAG: ribbon-helix-helix protein, CopG family [Nitrospirae bacterium]|nr:ribbon-helix-helix protein, CopG family [Nitrospirota bacterium]
MEEKKQTGRPRTHGTASERVQAWRLRNLRKVYRTEILLSADDAMKLDTLCQKEGLDRSSIIRRLIREA